jgi:predicted NUDIX family phosphoesterase
LIERKAMGPHLDSLDRNIDRELERELHERALHDDERTGLGLCDELRTKDAREHVGAVNLRRPAGH